MKERVGAVGGERFTGIRCGRHVVVVDSSLARTCSGGDALNLLGAVMLGWGTTHQQRGYRRGDMKAAAEQWQQ